MQACDAYAMAAAGSPAAQGRIHTVVADIALDLAEDSVAGTPYAARTAFLKLAAPYVRRGVHLAREGADASGEALALLTRARYDRLSDHQVDRLRSINVVVRLARALQDAPLSSQAYVALGKELAAQGWDVAIQINCYDKGQQALAGSDVGAIERLALREGLRARELRDYP